MPNGLKFQRNNIKNDTKRRDNTVWNHCDFLFVRSIGYGWGEN